MNIKMYFALAVVVLGTACASGGGAANKTPPAQTKDRAPQTPVAVGAAAPDFTLEDQNGTKVRLSEASGKTPVVLVFYRGYW